MPYALKYPIFLFKKCRRQVIDGELYPRTRCENSYGEYNVTGKNKKFKRTRVRMYSPPGVGLYQNGTVYPATHQVTQLQALGLVFVNFH